jgi:acyl-CoA synthetase (AMP-forming)/AMP-acid ligase II
MSFDTLTQALDCNLSSSHLISYLGSNNEESKVSFTDLKDRALGILFNLQQKNIKPGDQLIILTESNEMFLDAFWAGLYGGIIPVPVATASNDEHRLKLLRIFKKLESPYIYTHTKTLDQIRTFCLNNDMVEVAEQLQLKSILIDGIDDISQPGKIHPAATDDTAFIQFSSGSTSEPKGVVLTHKNIMTNIYAIIKAAAITRKDTMLSWMPLTHDMGMIGFHLTPIVVCANHTIMDTNVFVRRPLLWLTAASDKQVTILCSPNFGYKHFLKVYASKGIEQIDLTHIRLIFNGAEPISLELCHQFLNTMATYGLNKNAMFPVYGLAEASLAVSFPRPEGPIESIQLKRQHLAINGRVETGTGRDTMEFIFVGEPVENCHVRITDSDDNALPEKTVGKIQLKGDNVTKGYYQADDINKQLFTDDGWLDTGDLGAFINKQLIITGRIKDIIFVNGQNFYSHDLENILHRLDNLELGKVIVTGARKSGADDDELLVFILYRGETEAFIPLVKTIRKTINETTGVEVHQVIPVKRIPKTTSGKVQRHLLSEQYISGEFDEQIDRIQSFLMTSSDNTPIDEDGTIESILLQICNTTVEDKDIKLDDNLFEIGISSLSLAEIHEQLDELYPGKVDIADLFDHPTVRELSAFLDKLTG